MSSQDENGKGRLKARIATLFPGTSVQFVGVENDFEAAINLVRELQSDNKSSPSDVTSYSMDFDQVDIVDAYDGRPGIILANVARREGGVLYVTRAYTLWRLLERVHVSVT